MSEELKSDIAHDEKAYTTPPETPNSALQATDGWKMPQPVFRQTSGRLPRGFDKQIRDAGGPEGASTSPASATDPARAVIDIEPQPDISEEFSEGVLDAPAAKPHGRTAMRIALVLLGLVAMVAFALGFIVLVYFLFFASRPETGF